MTARDEPFGAPETTAPAPARRRSWIRVALVVVPVIALVSLLGAVLAGSGTSGALSSGPAPSFLVRDLRTGAPITDSSLAGHVVVLNFWASWCTPCAQEAPALRTAYERTRADGVRFVGITYQDDPASARAFAAGHGVTWPLAADPGAAAADAFGVVGVPETIVLTATGDVAAHAVGPVTARDLVGWIDEARRSS